MSLTNLRSTRPPHGRAAAHARAAGAALRRRPGLSDAAVAGLLAALVVWLGPAGTDFPAHAFQLRLYEAHGLALWNDQWYAGRYTFVGYSLLYYPLAALVGIRLLAVASAALAAAAFGSLAERLFGGAATPARRAFAPLAAASLLSGAFPYALGLALALAALALLARGRRDSFAVLVLLAWAASPLAFLFVLVALAAAWRRRPVGELLVPGLALALGCLAELALWRLFPDPGHDPFPASELAGALLFCLAGAALCWREGPARLLARFFVAYAAVCALSYLLPSNLGGNVARLRLAALPLCLLALALGRLRWRPLAVALAALGLAWNLSPLAHGLVRAARDPSASEAYWRPLIAFLAPRLGPSYRVEVVATADHWEALYLPEAGIPLAQGWFRQDDFPENGVLYGRLTAASYRAWLRRLAVRYVVLTGAALDESATGQAALLRGGASGLRVVLRARHATVYAVPAPRAIVSGPGHPRVLTARPDGVTVELSEPGSFLVSLRYSPYLAPPGSCISEAPGGMTRLVTARSGVVRIAFAFSGAGALAALTGARSVCATGPGLEQ